MENNKVIKGVATGAGLVALVAAAAGMYFLYGSKDSVKNRKKVKSWMLQAKGEVLEQLENLSEVNEDVYKKIVKEVSDKYQALKSIDQEDVMEFMDELKGHWKNIAKELSKKPKKSKK
ncbi:MAG: hypothetical protein NTV36_00500 [Candidatus Staskawiczbacteria bacterium]|nr:hypothetical protein [Candidatus Staskawiczbacteria bacterium]